jgi:heterodisulfide reductase subunit C
MDIINITSSYDREFVESVKEESEQDPYLCYQCGNCTAGCPFTFAFDIPVHQVMRLLQAGQKEKILKSHSIWLCATCEQCTTRCPCNVDVARIMDVLRHIARREGYVSEKEMKLFADAFLDSVRKHGRLFEMGLLFSYNTRSGRLLTDADLGPKVMKKGKISLRPHNIKGKEKVAQIFSRFIEGSKRS